MKTYLISYDLHKSGRKYDSLFGELQKFDGYLHCLESLWFVCSELSAKEIRDKLRMELDVNDEIIVLPIHKDYATFIADFKNEWLEKNILCDSFY